MKYEGKKLPSGWTYIVTKKDLAEINNETDNCITSVILGGTSYSESKMATQWTDKTVATIDFAIIENNLFTYLTLHGIRNTNFNSDSEFLNAKTKAISDITAICLDAKRNFAENNSKSASEFIKVATAQTPIK